MAKLRTLVLLVVAAHWIVAIWHLFLAARILPAPNNHVSWLAIVLITSGHMVVSSLVWKLSDKVAGFVSVIFFLAAMCADLYEHFLHASQNNVFMVARGDWTAVFNASVFILLALEIVGCLLGTVMLGGKRRNSKSTPGPNSKFSKQIPKLCSSRFGYVPDDFGEIVLLRLAFAQSGTGSNH
jgi:hypothetical protein